jgi:dTDP-4-amino-4,6-dideoxy-D-galactose acyltransferase
LTRSKDAQNILFLGRLFKMEKNTIETLEWDSQFFGYPVARVLLDQDGRNNLDILFRKLKSGKYRVTYLFVPPEENGIINRIIKEGGILVDQKTVFSKVTEKHDKLSKNLIELQETEINDNLKKLALQAGLNSRFHLDKNFSNNEYEKLYIEWLIKSIKKELAFKIIVAKRNFDIIGLTTLGGRSNYADIGLVAVDENFRGQGIGCDLVKTADTIACGMGFKTIKVVTQLINKAACRLYEKCNFQIENITNIYHYWQ